MLLYSYHVLYFSKTPVLFEARVCSEGVGGQKCNRTAGGGRKGTTTSPEKEEEEETKLLSFADQASKWCNVSQKAPPDKLV